MDSGGATTLWRSSSGDQRPRTYVALQFLKRFYVQTPIVANGSLSRASTCGSTNTLIGKGS